MEDGSKRLKIDDDLLFSEEARRVMSTDFCVPCGKSYSFTQKREYWIHMIGHTRSTIYEEQRLERPEDARLPWYAHSIYQDRSVNESRFKPEDFTNLVLREDPCFELHRRMVRPFTTHFWINYNGEKTGDAIRDYFGVKANLVNKNAKVQTGVDPNLIISYKCSLCSQKVFKRPSFIQTALAILIHVFYDHRSNKALRDAALQDILSFQQASGIEIYMEKAPDYRPLIATDLIPKETELFYLMLSKRAPSGTREPFLCSQCLQLFNTYPVFEKHLKEKHGCDLYSKVPGIMCVSESRYGHRLARRLLDVAVPFLIVQSDDKSEYSWACYQCGEVLRDSEDLNLIVRLASHTISQLNGCPVLAFSDMSRTHTLFNNLIKTFKAAFSGVNQARAEMMSAAMSIEPISIKQIHQCFIRLGFIDMLQNWLYPLLNSTGLVELCRPLTRFYIGTKEDDDKIFICPLCFKYFLTARHAYLHLQPDECTELKKYKFTLDPNVVAEAKKKCEELAQ